MTSLLFYIHLLIIKIINVIEYLENKEKYNIKAFENSYLQHLKITSLNILIPILCLCVCTQPWGCTTHTVVYPDFYHLLFYFEDFSTLQFSPFKKDLFNWLIIFYCMVALQFIKLFTFC